MSKDYTKIITIEPGKRGGKPCIKVYVEKDDPRLRSRLPRRTGRFAVDIEVTGKVRRL